MAGSKRSLANGGSSWAEKERSPYEALLWFSWNLPNLILRFMQFGCKGARTVEEQRCISAEDPFPPANWFV
jgi:hypothetical protein